MSADGQTPPATDPYVLDGILFNDDARMATWIHERMGVGIPVVTLKGFRAFGMIVDDRVVAGAYFNDLIDQNDFKDITFCAAIDETAPPLRSGLKRVFEYPFVELKLPRVSAQISMDNKKAIEQAMAVLGFQLEGVKKLMGPGRGEVGMFGLYRDACPFLKG